MLTNLYSEGERQLLELAADRLLGLLPKAPRGRGQRGRSLEAQRGERVYYSEAELAAMRQMEQPIGHDVSRICRRYTYDAEGNEIDQWHELLW